ncbi:MAG: asparagine synthetase B [Planctomycetia bacterium]
MCGITGLILTELDPEAGRLITAMTQAVFHRGPDDGGAVVFGLGGRPVVHRRLGTVDAEVQWDYLSGQVALGARRLAVIDTTEAGHQPMTAGEDQPWLVFNGAIYNHRALREELSAAGMAFGGRSDTEVVLAAYRHWGVECFRRFEGMWALAIYDPAAGRVVLSRDRFGIKPLHLTRTRNAIAFGSEIKSLLTGVSRDADGSMLRDFLAYGWVDHSDRTMFEGIWSMPPGCALTFDLRGARDGPKGTLSLYDDASETAPPHSNGNGSEEILESIRSAVRSHLFSDVPVGSCLSGGLDSSLIVGLLSEMGRDGGACGWSQHTFTACATGEAIDERRYAEAVVGQCQGLNAHYVEPTGEGLVGDMAQLLWHQEQPFGSPSIYMQWEVMRAARAAGVTVLLDGQGADELFCGYPGYFPPLLASLLRRGHVGRFAGQWSGVIREGHYTRRALAAHTAAHLWPISTRDRLRAQFARRRSPWLVGELFDTEESAGIVEGLGLEDRRRERAAGGTSFDAFCRRVIFHESLPSLLRFEDRSSMAHSIEARVPYLDRRVAAAAMSVPAEERLRDGRLKAMLREAASGHVPEAVLNRRDKIGFAAPTVTWMRGALGVWWREAIGSKTFRERGCFSPGGAEKLGRRFDEGDDSAALALWRAALTEQWARIYLDR